MESQPKKWYGTWWAMLLALALGAFVGWLLKTYCYLGGESGINI